jgi:hypothetical protein
MNAYRIARHAAAFLVLGFAAAFTSLSIYTQGDALYESVKNFKIPKSVEDVRNIKNDIAAVENAVNVSVWSRMKFIEGYSYLQVLMGKEETGAFDIVRSRNGELNYGNFYQNMPDGVAEYAARVRRLKYFAESRGCKVLYINPLPIVQRGFSDYSPGIPPFDRNAEEDALLYYLQSYGVDCLDSRAILSRSGLPPDRWRFRTDHHMTIEANFEIFRALVEKMNDDYAANIDLTGFYRDIQNYNVRHYPGVFLGTLGARTGAVFSGFDDYTLIWPKFSTNFVREALYNSEFELHGPFESVMLVPDNLGKDEDGYFSRMYGIYTGGHSWARIINKLMPDGKKLFAIHDSHFISQSAFLAPLFGEIHMIWPLAFSIGLEKTNIEQYMREHIDEFDYIIIELDAANINNDGFAFFESPSTVTLK